MLAADALLSPPHRETYAGEDRGALKSLNLPV